MKSGLAEKPRGPGLSPAQLQAWNGALEALREAKKRHEEGDVEKAHQALERATTQAMILPPSSAPIWLSIARSEIAIGALSEAGEALSQSGNEAGVEEARADLERLRRWGASIAWRASATSCAPWQPTTRSGSARACPDVTPSPT